MTAAYAGNHAWGDTELHGEFNADCGRFANRSDLLVGQFDPSVSRNMLGLGTDLQILPAIVGLVAVDVVDDLRAQQRTTKVFLGNKPMFGNVPARVRRRVVRPLDVDVPAAHGPSALPVWVRGAVSAVVSVPAGQRTEAPALSVDGVPAELTGVSRIPGHGDLQSLCRAGAGNDSARHSHVNDAILPLRQVR